MRMTDRHPRVCGGIVCATLSVVLGGCGSAVTSSSSGSRHSASSPASAVSKAALAPATREVTIAISDYSYHPAKISVAAGTKVTFTNHDQTPHTATSTTTGFDTGTVNPGRSATVDFSKPGTYTYYCQFHAFMRGTIVVK